MKLFAYGTLRDAEFRRALFEHDYPSEPAHLRGYRIVVAETGYFSLRADPLAEICGDLIDLDARGWELADRWEEVPAYERTPVVARTAHNGEVPCIAYIRPTASTVTPPPGAFACHDRRRVLAEIAATKRASSGSARNVPGRR
jgi:gamma-glutamylcyclotransferase (GGCT)/AIG2-like uncharacterized protein YtfP